MPFERRTTQYQPQLPPGDMEYGGFIFQEFQRVANVLELQAQGRLFEETYEEPEKPRNGQVVLADGTQWDPGSGRGIYWYDGNSNSWNKLG